jgi:hypothetical protein
VDRVSVNVERGATKKVHGTGGSQDAQPFLLARYRHREKEPRPQDLLFRVNYAMLCGSRPSCSSSPLEAAAARICHHIRLGLAQQTRTPTRSSLVHMRGRGVSVLVAQNLAMIHSMAPRCSFQDVAIRVEYVRGL